MIFARMRVLLLFTMMSLLTTLAGADCWTQMANLSCSGLSNCLSTAVIQIGTLCEDTRAYSSSKDTCKFNIQNCSQTGYTHFSATNITSLTDCISLSLAIDDCTIPGGGGGGCPELPQSHPTPPKSLRTAMSPVIAIPGHGAFAENRLALLYDDGYGGNTTHRLAFATMAPPDTKEPVSVYLTRDLPAIFEAEYGYVEVILVEDLHEGDALQSLFKMSNAYAAIRLSNGALIGLVDQIHHEDWYIDLRQYLARYKYRASQHILNPNPEEPVKLNLATVFTWTGEEWVTDPLLVLDVLQDAFPPSSRDLALLQAATRKPQNE